MSAIAITSFRRAIADLLTEVGVDAPEPRGTWIVSNEAGSGVLGCIDRLDAAQASCVPAGCAHSLAGHVGHLVFAFDLFTRAARGEDAYSTAKWSESWRVQRVDDAQWNDLRTRLRMLITQAIDLVNATEKLESQDLVTGGVALVAHTAYHLGAIKQLVRMSS